MPKKATMIYEACVETFEQALKAEQNGAHRIELCSHLELDGLTPSPGLISETCSRLSIPVMVMIRPRGGDFVYTGEEIELMEKEIALAKDLGADGIVFGLLTPDNQIDLANTDRLAKAAMPLPVTFHKAIDQLDDPAEGVRQLLAIEGITRILTSGGKPTAKEGAGKIREMIKLAKGKIIILAAGSITHSNRDEMAALTGAVELHGKKIVGDLLR